MNPEEFRAEADEKILTICRNVCYLRKSRSYTKRRMCGILSISPYSLRKLERGIFPPRLNQQALFLLADHFGLKVDQLFTPLSTILRGSSKA